MPRLHVVLLMAMVVALAPSGTTNAWQQQGEEYRLADHIAGSPVPVNGVFTEGGVDDVTGCSTYVLRVGDTFRRAFDSQRLEERVETELAAAGLGLERVRSERDADLRIDVKVDRTAGTHGVGAHVSVFLNAERRTPTKHQLLYSYEGVAATPEDVLAKFASALAEGLRTGRRQDLNGGMPN
jgi:hypothetical protein